MERFVKIAFQSLRPYLDGYDKSVFDFGAAR